MPLTQHPVGGQTQTCDRVRAAGLFGCCPFTMLTRSIQNYDFLEHENVLHVEVVFWVLFVSFVQ